MQIAFTIYNQTIFKPKVSEICSDRHRNIALVMVELYDIITVCVVNCNK